uniref:Putative rna-binding protein n=2 Tax=Anopheles triannulatus TaxID=58253 RepID=A0A2M4A7M2_9DIPT
MPRINFSRTERFAQMSQQEQLIAQKRQQIMEKQRTLELAKQIAAEASKDTPSVTEAPEAPEAGTGGGKVVLPFSNDGSFLERFKQLSEKIVKQTEDQVKPAIVQQPDPTAALPAPPPEDSVPAAVGVSASISTNEHLFKFDIPPPSLLPTLPPPPPPPPPPQLPTMADDVHFEPFYDLPPIGGLGGQGAADAIADRAEPGPGSDEQRINTAGEVDSSFQVLSEHDKLPTTVEELIQLVADIGDVYEDKLCSRKNDLHPSLWFIFDKHSEAYGGFRRMIMARRSRATLAAVERSLGPESLRKLQAHAGDDDAKYDPADVLDDSIVDAVDEEQDDEDEDEDEEDEEVANRDAMYHEDVAVGTATGRPVSAGGNEIPIHMMPNFYGDERHFYDDKSTTETDSDTEYVREARERNLKNLKRKTFDAGNRREDGSSTDSDDDYHTGLGDSANESTNEKNGGSSGAGGSATGGSAGTGGRNHRQKYRKKSRWGESPSEGVGGPGTAGRPVGDDQTRKAEPSPWAMASNRGTLNRNNPGLLQYVYRHYGTVEDVSPECWNKAEEHYRLQLLFEDLTAKVQQHDRFLRSVAPEGPPRDGGLRAVGSEDEERRLNAAKQDSIHCWIREITHLYERIRPGHLSEFLMRDDYERFVEQFRRTSDRQPSFDDYKEFRLQEANAGFLAQIEDVPAPQESGSRKPEYSSTDSDFVSYREQSQPGSQQQQQQQQHGGQGESRGHDNHPSTTGDTGSGMKRAAEEQLQLAAKRRKSRWGDQVKEESSTTHPGPSSQGHLQHMHGKGTHHPQGPPRQVPPTKLTSISRTDPALLAYARQNFGSTNLTEEEWKKAEDHYKINLLFQDMLRKRQEIDRLANTGRFKYAYDSDEDTTGGTWEHKLRMQEMEATQKWANELTRQSEGKHHIGDFLPPEELRKFMEKYDAQKNNRQPNLSDYKDYKLREDNVGYQMLQKLGWKQGQGLGADGSGIVDPINKASQRDNNQGLGIIAPDNPEVNDNEYDAYRKRMMLAYRFRPNPLNNPRRAYY